MQSDVPLKTLHIPGYSIEIENNNETETKTKTTTTETENYNNNINTMNQQLQLHHDNNTICHSSCEAEIKALDELVREAVHIMDITDFLGQHTGKHIDILLDSSSAITLCTTLRTYHRTKHINLRINYIREMINSGILVQSTSLHPY